jgi:hypothetical protein
VWVGWNRSSRATHLYERNLADDFSTFGSRLILETGRFRDERDISRTVNPSFRLNPFP